MVLLVALLLATEAVSPRGAVATAHPLASEAGASLLRHGGNAFAIRVAPGRHVKHRAVEQPMMFFVLERLVGRHARFWFLDQHQPR